MSVSERPRMPLLALRREAANLRFEGKLEQAAALYERLLRRSPRDPDIAFRLAELERRASHPDRALELYAQAAEQFRAAGLVHKAAAVEHTRAQLTASIFQARPGLARRALRALARAIRQLCAVFVPRPTAPPLPPSRVLTANVDLASGRAILPRTPSARESSG